MTDADTAERGRWEPWAHGRCWVTPAGDRTFYIRTVIGKDAKGRPRRFEVNTKRHELHEALAEWERFARNPGGYSPAGTSPRMPIYLDKPLSEEVLAWLKERGRSKRWRGEVRRYLAWWAEKLAGLDLRNVRFVDHVEPALAGMKSYRPRVAVILGLYRFLRQKKDLALDEDPVHGKFELTDPEPEQARRVKAVPLEHFQAALGHLVGIHRDLLLLQGDTGMHISEAWRFAKGGAIEPRAKNAEADGSAGVVVIPWHKSSAKGGKEALRVRVNATALAAADRILRHGAFSERRYSKTVAAACRAAGLAGDAIFTPGQMRHSVATRAINAGEDPANVTASFGHRSPKTVRKFYATYASPSKMKGTLSDAIEAADGAKEKGA